MRFLHTGDWHLGKILYSVSMAEEQRDFLLQLYRILENAENERKPFSAVLISGDLYDRAIPSVEAVSLFNCFLNEMGTRFPNTHVFIISGNHDGPERLGFASSLLSRANVHIQTRAEKISDAVEIDGCAVYQIPFLMPGSFAGEKLRRQGELYERATEMILEDARKNHAGLPVVVSAHATVYGNEDPENPLSVGTAESVSPDLFSEFDYTALGHIHKMQNLEKDWKICYSGSPLAYSFDDDAKKFVLSVEVEKRGGIPKIEKIPVKPLHGVKRLTGSFDDFYKSEKFDEFADFFIEIKCTDQTVTQNPMQLLRPKFPHLLSFVRSKPRTDENSKVEERRKIMEENLGKSEGELLKKFLAELYPAEAENARSREEIDAELRIFSQTVKEIRI